MIHPRPMFLTMPSKGLTAWPIYAAGVAMVIMVILMMNFPIAGVIAFHGAEDMADIWQLELDHNLILVLMLLPFIGGLVATLCIVKFLHRRTPISVVTARSRFDWRRMATAAGLNLVLSLFTLGVTLMWWPEEITWRGVSDGFYVLLLIAILLLPLQVSFEEVFIRGYLLQGIGWASKHAILSIVLTTVLFAVTHGANPEVAEYGLGLMMTYYFTYGLFLAVITVMDDGLELAIGCHLGTNFYAAVILGYEGGALQTDALMYAEMEMNWMSMLMLFPLLMIQFFIFSSLYRWPAVHKLWQPIVALDEEQEVDNIDIIS